MRHETRAGSQIRPVLRIEERALNDLMRTLEVNLMTLTEYTVKSGGRLFLSATAAPGVFFNLLGTGLLRVGDGPPVVLEPHTLVITPANRAFRIYLSPDRADRLLLGTVGADLSQVPAAESLRRNVSRDSDVQVILLCGYFHAFYGASIDLFSEMDCPIVERFEERDQLGGLLKAALAEFVAQRAGAAAMTAALLKQVLVKLLRRSLVSTNSWVEQFSVLRDAQLTRAFSDMVARPSACHSVQTLAQTAGLSRSIFMARFVAVFGLPPMSILRELRMHQASLMLGTGKFSIDQVAHRVGYTSGAAFRPCIPEGQREGSRHREAAGGPHPAPR